MKPIIKKKINNWSDENVQLPKRLPFKVMKLYKIMNHPKGWSLKINGGITIPSD